MQCKCVFADFDVVDVSKGDFKLRHVNNEAVGDWKRGPSLANYCNQAGAAGWELVGFDSQVVPEYSLNRRLLVFKRPKP